MSFEPGEKHGIFIDVEVSDAARTDTELAKKLEEACPVDIFATADAASRSCARTSTSACCASSAWTQPPGAVRVVKLYDGGAALERASASA